MTVSRRSTLTRPASRVRSSTACRARSWSASREGGGVRCLQSGTVVLASLGAQLAAMFVPPLRRLLGVTPLTASDCLVVAAGALGPALVQEARRRLTPSL